MAQSNVLKYWRKISPMRASRRRQDGGDHGGQELHERVDTNLAVVVQENILRLATSSSGWLLRGLDHCRFVRLAPHNTANQPEALNTVASVVIPS